MNDIASGDPLSLVTPIPKGYFNYLTNKTTTPAIESTREGIKGMLGDHFYIHDIKYGGMGEVFICSLNQNENPRVALKTFQKQFFFDPIYRISFENEAVNWSMLSGLPHIMPVMGIEETENRIFLMMPYVNNENSLNTFRDELTNANVPLRNKLRHFMQCLIAMRH